MADTSPSLETKNPEASVKDDGSSDANAYLRIIAKSFLSLHLMARDMNVARQNVQKLVKMKGGEYAKGADAMFLKEGEAETKLGVEREKLKPTPAAEPEKPLKKKSLLGNLMGGGIKKIKKNFLRYAKVLFSPSNLLKVLGKLALPLAIITTLWQGITGAWEAYKETGSIWEAFKGGISEIVDFFTFGLIDKDTVKNLMDQVADFFAPVTEAISNFFGKFSDWFAEKFDSIKSFFSIKSKPSEGEFQVEQDELLRQHDEAEKEYQKWKEEQEAQIKEQERELQRFKKAEEQARYQGEDEIVRYRLGLEEKSAATLEKEITAKKEAVAATAVSKEAKAEAVASTREGTMGAYRSRAQTGAPTPAPTAPTKEAAPPKVPTPSGDDKWVMDMIKLHEGVRTKPYKDSLGLWTVGVGHLIGDGKSLPPEWNREFTMQEIDALFAKDYEHHKKQAESTPGYSLANDRGRGALIDLAFNMGGAWYKKFKNASAKLASGDFKGAADDLVDSNWYKQVKGRAVTIVNLIKEGAGGAPTKVAETKPMTAQAPTPTGAAAAGPVKSAAASGGGSLASLVTKQSGVEISGFQAEFEKRLTAMAADFKEKTGKVLLVTSGYRSNEKQKQLFDEALRKNNGDLAATRKQVAEPMPPLGQGKGSFHLTGYAIDVNSKGDAGINALAGPRDKPTGWLESFGLTRPVVGEDWHIQPTGLSPTPDNPNKPGAPIAVAGKDGKPTDVATGKSEQIAGSSPSTGTQVAAASTEVASGQRQQQKPNTPIVMQNTVVNSTTVVKKNETTPPPQQAKSDTATTLANRAATA